ncbi:MAG: hypothetical protein ABIG63_07845 [Chloroflexota bacterium]
MPDELNQGLDEEIASIVINLREVILPWLMQDKRDAKTISKMGNSAYKAAEELELMIIPKVAAIEAEIATLKAERKELRDALEELNCLWRCWKPSGVSYPSTESRAAKAIGGK